MVYLLSSTDTLDIPFRAPAGIVYLRQRCSLEDEWDWEAV